MPPTSTRRRGLVAATISGLVVAPLAAVAVAAPAHAAPVDVTILSVNDFHGRIQANGTEAGAAVLSGAVKQLKAANTNTVFAAAGDLIGASTFESFVNDDNPTIDALNASGLEVSAVGNHEFDQGFGDLTGRVEPRAAWEYLGANVRQQGNPAQPALAESWTRDFGGVQVGFVGAVTQELPSLVSPSGISTITVSDIVAAANREAAELTAAGADAVVLLAHEGPANGDCGSVAAAGTAFGKIVTGASADIDAIVGAHTHQVVSCVVGGRPVASAGQYGENINQITLTVDPATGAAAVKTNAVLPLVTETQDAEGEPVYTANYPADPAVQAIVDQAVADAEVKGAATLGRIDKGFKRAQTADGEENRGGESTLGNLVAEVHRWATRTKTSGKAQIAFMNPGGLRADMLGDKSDGYPAAVSFKEAATVQPFANTLVNLRLTGRQIGKVLEEQWQPDDASRPFLRLGTSAGFRYTYDAQAKAGKRITGMWLKNKAIKGKKKYSVTVNSFLAGGGDNFSTFAKGAKARDTGKTDLQAMVDYLGRAKGAVEPAFAQAAVGARQLGTARGRSVRLQLSSLIMSAAGDRKDKNVTVSLGRQALGRFKVNTKPARAGSDAAAFDEAGKARVRVVLPRSVRSGKVWLTVRGARTGTVVTVPVTVRR